MSNLSVILLEKEILRLYQPYRRNYSKYLKHCFGGTECFSTNIFLNDSFINVLIKILEKRESLISRYKLQTQDNNFALKLIEKDLNYLKTKK